MNRAENTMQAVEYDAYGPPEVVHLATVPRPEPQPGEALVRVTASSVNPIDNTVRAGKLRIRTGTVFPKRVGIDFAGVIEQVPDGTPELSVGDRVFGVMPLTVERGVGQGSAAAYVTLPADKLARSPKTLDEVGTAAISSVGAVALITLIEKAALRPGERLLVRGAAGGVGSMLVQVGVMLGAHVTALASAKDLDAVRALGAAEVFDYRSTRPADLRPFDVIVDMVGTQLGRWRRRQTPRGRMFDLGVAGLGTLVSIALSRVFGAHRVQFFSAQPTGATMRELARHVDDGAIRPVVHSTYPLSDIAAAQRSLESGGGSGKRVLVHALS